MQPPLKPSLYIELHSKDTKENLPMPSRKSITVPDPSEPSSNAPDTPSAGQAEQGSADSSPTIGRTLSDLSGKFQVISDLTLNIFERYASQTTKEQIEESDSRIKKGPVGAPGSYVYAAYDGDGNLLYVGETGKSIKRRFTSDGNSSHKRNADWYVDMRTVKFLRLDSNLSTTRYRKLLESSLIFAGNPTNQGVQND